jgi:2-polyprenyl-3-methyl-5-hydroxy-6-metoxy-1,4-benzoquinol methylase
VASHGSVKALRPDPVSRFQRFADAGQRVVKRKAVRQSQGGELGAVRLGHRDEPREPRLGSRGSYGAGPLWSTRVAGGRYGRGKRPCYLLPVAARLSATEVAALSKGTSAFPILQAALRVLDGRVASLGCMVDVGCGAGDLFRALGAREYTYVGVDLVRYDGFPGTTASRFVAADLNAQIPLEDGIADVVVSIETIEHLENPRAFMRELVRLARPGGLVLVTTPNQLSFLSKLTLVVKNRFNAFTDIDYPAHITALLESDLRRIALECCLEDVLAAYTDAGRIPGTPLSWPKRLGFRGRAFSDNLLISGFKR